MNSRPEKSEALTAATDRASSEVSQTTKKGTIVSNSTALTIAGTSVRQHNGLFSLNDLHKAAGGEAKHQPALFMRMEQTKALIEEISSSTKSQSLVFETVLGKGKAQGTYACRELVIAYAAWISAAFHLKVIRVFLSATTCSHNPAIDYDRISPAQAQDLKEIVAAIVKEGIQGYGETWARFQRKFKVNSYLELPATQHLEARAYLIAKLPKGDAGATIEQPAPLPSLDPFNTRAMVAASKQAREYFDAARQGKYTDATAIPPEVLCGLLAQAMLEQRFMLSFDRDTGRMNFKPMPADAFVLSWPQFARGVVTNDIMATNTELAELAAACNHRLAQRLTA